MPRLSRLPSVPFGWYYVLLHVTPGRLLASTSAEFTALVGCLLTAIKRSGAHLHAGYADAQEVHLALQAGETPVSDVIRRFSERHALFLNRSRGETGRVWRPHARVVLIQHEVWLIKVAHVIHWQQQFRGMEHVGVGFWSTDAVYRRQLHANWVTTTVIWRMVAHQVRDPRVQLEAYQQHFDRPPDRSVVELLRRGSPNEPRILGSEAFVRAAQGPIGEAPRKRQVQTVQEEELHQAVRHVIAQLLVLCERMGRKERSLWRARLTLEKVCSRSRAHPLPMARGLVVGVAVRWRIATRAQLARFFSCGNSTVSARRQRMYELEYQALVAACAASGAEGSGEGRCGARGSACAARSAEKHVPVSGRG